MNTEQTEQTEQITIPLRYRPFFEKVKALKGRISTAKYHKLIEPKKKFVGQIGAIEKQSRFQVRAGIDYENITVVKEKHETGEVKRRTAPTSMKRVDKGTYHNINTGEWYVGCAPIINEHSVHDSNYFIDGLLVKLDDEVLQMKDKKGKMESFTLRDVLYAADLKTHSGDWINLNVKNIEDLTGI